MSPDMVFTDFRTSETDQMAVLEYSTKNHIMEIKFIIGFMVRDSIGIRISVSKRNFKAGEEKQLWEILNSVRFKEK